MSTAAHCAKQASLGVANEVQEDVLVTLGFANPRLPNVRGADKFKLTLTGRAFDDAANVYNDRDEATRLFHDAYLQRPETQALMQGLHGRGPVPVTGAVHLLARHGLADADGASAVRQLLTVLNSLGIVAYSVKHQAVRLLEPVPDSDARHPAQPSVRIVQPDRPYSNVRNLREVFRACRDYVWWADPHFARKGFEPLADEADGTRITEIRILSGPTQAGPDAVKDYKRFQAEMQTLGITVEWRIVETADREWHDRFIVSRLEAWNAPPLNTIFKGDYSEFTKTARPPFEEWWAKGRPLT